MKLTPLEIKQQQFEKTLRGYDTADVQSFLSLVSNEVEHLLNKNKELEFQIEKLNDRVRHYERVEEALHETLQTTKESVSQKLDNAKVEARSKVEKAEMEAEAIVNEAHQTRLRIRQNIQRLLEKREEIIVGMTSYLENSKEVLSKFGKDELGIFQLQAEEIEEPEKLELVKSSFQLDETTSDITKIEAEDDDEDVLSPGTKQLNDLLDEID